MHPTAIRDIIVPGHEPILRGKVRDIFDLGEHLLLVTSDRISAYDVVLPQGIPEKGAILTQLTQWWLDRLPSEIRHHLVSTQPADFPEPFREAAEEWGPRAMLVKKLDMIPVECVVRGYVVGSGWKDYQATGAICGIPLPEGMQQAERIDDPIFTPAAKNHDGHDENISIEKAGEMVGVDLMNQLKSLSVDIFSHGREHAATQGLILADTKFEFGMDADGPVLGDEVLTADSSRYWPADEYKVGASPPSFDKQYVRDYLASVGWTGEGSPPNLPAEVIEGTTARYQELFERVTGVTWETWKEQIS
ncbi:MAG: phosphoribosylaminoimidazolesuccinocarboxamide synthase [Planctomycetia bacterium]|jgi:phosphoribosylaminoimidazole-succinocarboxamide synthase|nr:phosphoribosylaminoimidazolesuccinocarboxamide synthase [Planctomycetia bacterium]NCF97892.1 phosphoribosylaminoimidazolesuccinocarboxamide synthase [Planctomycetia bacterium]NCG56377.1 phosphoribosylaminoimidazolesuccinocarboxamide synthase [Pseudomonadota bacterium]